MALFPETESKLFKQIVPNFLTDKELKFYSLKALTETIEDAYFCQGLFRGYFTDPEFAEILKKRIREYLSNNIKKSFIINDHFRISRYELKSFLPLHQDRVNIFNGYKSIYTINIFLNSDCGGTSFWNQESYGLKHIETIEAEAGTMCLFDINNLHRGEPVKNKQKLLLRTDVMIPVN